MHLLCPRTARQSRDCLRVRVLLSCTAIFAPSALFPGISRRCTGRCVRLRLRSPRYRRIRFNRECHPSWHLRRLASRRYASHRNPTASAQAVCHPLSGGSVACLVSACASLHAGDCALCAVIAVQCLQFVLCRARRGLLCNGGLLDIALRSRASCRAVRRESPVHCCGATAP